MRPSPEHRLVDAFDTMLGKMDDDDVASLKAHFDEAEEAHDAWRAATVAYDPNKEQAMKMRKELRRELHLLKSYLAIWALDGLAELLVLAEVIEKEDND